MAYAFSPSSVKRHFCRIVALRRIILHVVPFKVSNHTRYSGQAVSSGVGRAGSPAALFGKTLATAGFPELQFSPAGFFPNANSLVIGP